jgi:hypothetical protein
MRLEPDELRMVERAFRDAATGAPPRVNPAERQKQIYDLSKARMDAAMAARAAADAKRSAKSRDLVADVERTPGARKLPDGVVVAISRPRAAAPRRGPTTASA